MMGKKLALSKLKLMQIHLFQVKDVVSITLEDAIELLQYPITLVYFLLINISSLPFLLFLILSVW